MGFRTPPPPPPDAERVRFGELAGRTLLIRPDRIETKDGKDGPYQVVVAEVVVLDDPDGVQVHKDMWISGVKLVPQLADAIDDGETVLGRLGKGEPIGAAGNRANVLLDPRPSGIAAARRYLGEPDDQSAAAPTAGDDPWVTSDDDEPPPF
jgi:hypothetical protein